MKIEQLSEQLTRIEKLLEAQQPPPMSFEEARVYLRCSRGTLYRMTSRGEIVHYKPSGKRLFFAKADLDAFLTKHRVRTKEEIRQEVLNG